MKNRKTILYIAASLDGYVAKPNDNLDFLQMVETPNEDYGYGDFYKQIDTVILGKRTYDWVMNQVDEFPHKEKETYVLTRKEMKSMGKVQFYNGKLSTLVKKLKNNTGKDVFIDGGAQTVHRFLELKLIDEMIISFIPILLGDGIRLFDSGFPEQKLELIKSKTYSSGLLQVHYRFIQ